MTAEDLGQRNENQSDSSPVKSGKASLLLFLVGFSLLGWFGVTPNGD